MDGSGRRSRRRCARGCAVAAALGAVWPAPALHAERGRLEFVLPGEQAPAAAAAPTAQLVPPADAPLAEDAASDPVIAIGRTASSGEQFRVMIAEAVARDARIDEARANVDEARAGRTRARAALYPRADVQLTTNQNIARRFGNDVDTVVERAQSERRTDASLSIEQSVFDFGANEARIEAAGARLRAAALGIDDTGSQIALNAIGAWYDVFGYRALTELARSAVARQTALRADIEVRIANGYLARGDAARSDGYVAAAEARVATYIRRLANAEARFTQLAGVPAPPGLARAPFLGAPLASQEAAIVQAGDNPAVKAAQALADGARSEARAYAKDRLPTLNVSLGAGRYGFAEGLDDYSVSGRVTVRQQFSGGFNAAKREYDARANAAEARADRTLQDASRDAAIAWSDVNALATALASLERSTIATRQARDVLAERFRVSRGDLFELESAEQNYFDTAASYLETLTELDAARYVLLARTGKLLDVIGIAAAPEGQPK